MITPIDPRLAPDAAAQAEAAAGQAAWEQRQRDATYDRTHPPLTPEQVARTITDDLVKHGRYGPEQSVYDPDTGTYQGDMDGGHRAARVSEGQWIVCDARPGVSPYTRVLALVRRARNVPDPIADATEDRDRSQQAWVQAIRDEVAAGGSVDDVARRAGISRARVYQIRDGR